MGVIIFIGVVMFRLIFLLILICAAALVGALIAQLIWELGKWLTDKLEH